MLPHTHLSCELRDGIVCPHYLTSRDEPWVRLLVDELDALVGRTHGDVARILGDKTQQIATSYGVPIAAVRAVRHSLERLWRARPAAGVPSREIRRVVFELGADGATPRDEVLRRAAGVLGIRTEQVSEGLFADSSSERRLSAPREEPSPRAIVGDHNVTLIQELLLRSEQVTVHVGPHAAPVLRVAKQKGLMYSFSLDPRGATLTFPGPLSLFRQTLRYGRALASLFPAVAGVPGWSLEAKCLLGVKMGRFHAGESDPIVAAPTQDIDNAVERRLLYDFRRLGSSWSIAHATELLRGSGFTFFPDFTLERGMDRVHIEIIGFHTAAYLKDKLEALRNAGISSVLLCVDDSLACSERAVPTAGSIFHFQKRVEVGRLLRTLEHLVAQRDVEPDSDQPSS